MEEMVKGMVIMVKWGPNQITQITTITDLRMATLRIMDTGTRY